MLGCIHHAFDREHGFPWDLANDNLATSHQSKHKSVIFGHLTPFLVYLLDNFTLESLIFARFKNLVTNVLWVRNMSSTLLLPALYCHSTLILVTLPPDDFLYYVAMHPDQVFEQETDVAISFYAPLSQRFVHLACGEEPFVRFE